MTLHIVRTCKSKWLPVDNVRIINPCRDPEIWDVQRKDTDTLLVHTTYARQADHVADVSGFIWKRIGDSP